MRSLHDSLLDPILARRAWRLRRNTAVFVATILVLLTVAGVSSTLYINRTAETERLKGEKQNLEDSKNRIREQAANNEATSKSANQRQVAVLTEKLARARSFLEGELESLEADERVRMETKLARAFPDWFEAPIDVESLPETEVFDAEGQLRDLLSLARDGELDAALEGLLLLHATSRIAFVKGNQEERERWSDVFVSSTEHACRWLINVGDFRSAAALASDALETTGLTATDSSASLVLAAYETQARIGGDLPGSGPYLQNLQSLLVEARTRDGEVSAGFAEAFIVWAELVQATDPSAELRNAFWHELPDVALPDASEPSFIEGTLAPPALLEPSMLVAQSLLLSEWYQRRDMAGQVAPVDLKGLDIAVASAREALALLGEIDNPDRPLDATMVQLSRAAAHLALGKGLQRKANRPGADGSLREEAQDHITRALEILEGTPPVNLSSWKVRNADVLWFQAVSAGGEARDPGLEQALAVLMELKAAGRLPAPYSRYYIRAIEGHLYSENKLGMQFVKVAGMQARMGRCEVTVGQYREFVTESGHQSSPARRFVREGEKWIRDLDGRVDWVTLSRVYTQSDDHPVIGVSIADAEAFCAWLSAEDPKRTYRLPTVEEWQRAADAEFQTYAWGNDWPPPFNNVVNIAGLEAGTFPGQPAQRSDNVRLAGDYEDNYVVTAPVRTFSANRFGIFNLAGNVREWAHDGSGEKGTCGASWIDLDRGSLELPLLSANAVAAVGTLARTSSAFALSSRAPTRETEIVSPEGCRPCEGHFGDEVTTGSSVPFSPLSCESFGRVVDDSVAIPIIRLKSEDSLACDYRRDVGHRSS